MAIHQALLDKINLSMLDKLPEEQIRSEITTLLPELLASYDQPLNREERANLVTEVMNELLGLGPLEPLLKDESITDILVNGCDIVFVERGGVLERVTTRFQDERRSEEHTSELQSLMRISYAAFCLKKKTKQT